MKQIDVRFSDQEMAELQSMIGKKMLRYKCEPFWSSPSAYGAVEIALEDASYAFTNFTEAMDYYGVLEDVALFKIEQEAFDQIEACLQEVTMIEYPVDQIIRKIDVIQERQCLYENEVLIYEVFVTRGVIFFFENAPELSLEKCVWFSEDIAVMRGYDLIDHLSPTSDFEENRSEGYVGKCDREIVTLQS